MNPPPQIRVKKFFFRALTFMRRCLHFQIFFEKIPPAILYNPNHPQSPLNPWAFIRVCNEIETLEQSLNSILGAIKRGIIVYNECTDGSEEVIKKFCEKNKGFICVEYPHKVLKVAHTHHERAHKNKLCDYYNFALSFIPQNEWLIKIDADQIYDSQKLKESFKLIKTPRDVLVYGQINLHIFNHKVYLQKVNTFKQYGDCLMIRNTFLHHIEWIISKQKNHYYAYEILVIGFWPHRIYPKCDTWHFPLIKKARSSLAKVEDYLPLQEYEKVLQKEVLEGKIALDMLDEKRILAHF